MITSPSITATANNIDTHHGNPSTVAASRPMDLDRQEFHPRQRHDDHDAMDTSVDVGPDDAHPVNHADPQSTEPAPLPPDAPAVLERPREEQGRAPGVDRKAYTPPKPELTHDLLSVYHLHAIVASVARTDPVTGEKINRLRKSYEGKVKALGLAGRNRAVKHEKDKMIGLAALADWPEEEWQNQKVMGRDVSNGLPGATRAKLEKAMRMQPGPVPNNTEWEDLLGFEKVAPVPAVMESAPKGVSKKEVPAGKANGVTNGARLKTGKASAADGPRPKRSGKKRRYDEQSFEGYGEGFVDDEGDPAMTGGGGGSSGDGSRTGGVSKKRRKEYGPSTPSGLNDRTGSYGVGMMGMGSGIGAYSR